MKKIISLVLLAFACLLPNSFNNEVNGMNKIKAETSGIGQDPVLVNDNSFETSIVADVVITEAPFNADNTGKEDVTEIVKDAIKKLNILGGGTIYFPKGKYRITSSITVNNYITLMGNYVDPDTANGDYGTVIIADVEQSLESLPALFRLRGSSGVVGMTIWYPGQCADDVRCYPSTFEIMGGAFTALEHMQFTIQNVTLINSYIGVIASRTVNPSIPVGQSDAHENLVIENLKGTVLRTGIDSVNESDIGYFKNIKFNASYWANAKCFRNSADKEVIEKFTLNYGCGMKLGDLEWSPYYDIEVTGFKTGVHIIKGTRIQPDNPIAFMGGFYNLKIENCQYGLVVDELYVGWGMLVTHSSISASIASVVNNAPVGYVRLTDVLTTGEIKGKDIYINDSDSADLITKTPAIPAPKSKLYDVVKDYKVKNDGFIDATNGIRKALEDADKNGGGIVYLRAGYYKVTDKLVIPENVQLRGCTPISNRDNNGLSAGTMIFSYFDEDSNSNITDDAFITVKKNAGVYGMRICYPNNNVRLVSKNEYKINRTAFTVRLLEDNSYCMNVGLVDSYNGVEVRGNNCVVKNMPCLFFNKGIYVNGCNGNVHVENIFSNATIATQSSLSNKFPSLFKDSWQWKLSSLWNYYTYTETHTTIVTVKDSKSVNLMSIFTYCSAYLVDASNSTVFMNGCGGDRMWADGFVVNLEKTNITMINTLKYHAMMFGQSKGDTSKINVFGRMNLDLGGVASTFETDCNVIDNVEQKETVLPNSDGEVVSYGEDNEWKKDNALLNPIVDILG